MAPRIPGAGGGRKGRPGARETGRPRVPAIRDIVARLEDLGDPVIAEHSQRFFKT